MVHNLSQSNSLINEFVSELRDTAIQGDRMRFRRNLERIGEIFAYEISKTLPYVSRDVTTPLGIANMQVLREQPVVGTILRAGLPLHQGVLNYFDRADNAFISAYRKHHKDGTFDIKLEYVSCPSLENRVLILADPMLATGSSMVMTAKAIRERGNPSHTHIVAAVASTYGVEFVKSHLPENVTIWCAAIDDELTAQSYIVPGLGDAGDLAYGTKL
ncbi:MAG: uracil phosphoribosyltransferase [Bacteroidia bacterium]|jgi:uracil phosphoribosyltransferase|nr:uracil phosphoribosyltransferase [Bacteroidia bacterium]MBP6009585.1 uracil phosphoribosyltransferase [Bacteroidia bacterium]MBP7270475.1 uracil phosphoribosyltransferase [Bacteroidia bacterium]MBP7438226.1 uracil phosphoribosyltransferase [Bacteroidia bacterium]MBP7771670.1 uracil phosphoribosyltransferase [Bacteroidia bacterium]